MKNRTKLGLLVFVVCWLWSSTILDFHYNDDCPYMGSHHLILRVLQEDNYQTVRFFVQISIADQISWIRSARPASLRAGVRSPGIPIVSIQTLARPSVAALITYFCWLILFLVTVTNLNPIMCLLFLFSFAILVYLYWYPFFFGKLKVFGKVLVISQPWFQAGRLSWLTLAISQRNPKL